MWAPVASADDSSVYGAWVSRDGDFAKLGRQYQKDLELWVRSGHKKQAPVLEVIAKTRKLCGTVNAAIGAESPSSADGKRGKSSALASDSYLAQSLGARASSIRARSAGRIRKARALAARADSLLACSGKAEKRARKAFKAAGVHLH